MNMKKIFLTIITFCILQSYSQVGIGTTNPHPSSILDINSATQGLLVPRLTTIERNAISAPANGLMIYNTTISCFKFFNGITWQSLCNTSVEPTISSIPCNAPFTVTPSGNGVAGLPYNKTVSIPYLGGNGASYSEGAPIASTGVTGLTATLNAGTLATGSGNFIFTISGTPDPFVSISNTASAIFNFSFDGKICSFSVTIDKARIGSTINCSTAVVENPSSGSNGIPYNGTITVTYSSSILTNGGAYASQNINSTGVTGLTASIPAGFVNASGGTLVFTVTGTPNSTGNAQFNLSNFINGLNCSGSNVQIVISGPPIVSSLNCSGATHSPSSATQGSPYTGTTSLPYTGGNGVGYTSHTINSTGVTGLIATLSAGTLTSGSGGILTYSISGIPNSSGLASFEVNFGGQTCVFSIPVNGRVISIAYLDGSAFFSTSQFGQQTVPQNYGPSGIFNTIGGILHDDYTSSFNSGVSPLTMRNTREIIACGPNKTVGSRSLSDCQRIRDYVALGGIAIITLDANNANAITTSNNYHAVFGGTGTFVAGSNPTTVNSTIALSSSYWGTANAGVAVEGTGVSAEFSGTAYTLPIGAQVLARFTNGKPAIWTCGEGNRAIFICDDGFLRNTTNFTTITINTDQEKFFHNLLKNYILVHLGF